MSQSLHGIAKALGGKVTGGAVRCPGPGHSRHDDSLVVMPANNEDGFTVHSHAGDDWTVCKDFVREALGLPGFSRSNSQPAVLIDPMAEADERRRAEAKKRAVWALWAAALPFAGSPAEQYLRKRLAGFPVPPEVIDGGALRYQVATKLPDFLQFPGAVGVMVAAMTSDPDTLVGVHLTYFDRDHHNVKEERGPKRLSIRRMWGSNGIVRLWPDEDVTTGVAVGEGIESVLSASLLTGCSPAWAALNADSVRKFAPIPGVECLTLFADNDASETGQNACRHTAEQWSEAGREAVIKTPRVGSTDFNDMLLNLVSERGAA